MGDVLLPKVWMMHGDISNESLAVMRPQQLLGQGKYSLGGRENQTDPHVHMLSHNSWAPKSLCSPFGVATSLPNTSILPLLSLSQAKNPQNSLSISTGQRTGTLGDR